MGKELTKKTLFTKNLSFITVAHRPIILKGKAVPLQAWTGPEDSTKLRLPDFKTMGT